MHDAPDHRAPAAAPFAPPGGAGEVRLEPSARAQRIPAEGATVSRRAVVRVATAATLILYGYSVIQNAEMAPARALVLADAAAHTFTTPACAAGRAPSQPALTVTTKGAAEAAGYAPDAQCWRSGGFLGAGSSRWMQVLRFVHLYPAQESRWRADGTWRW